MKNTVLFVAMLLVSGEALRAQEFPFAEGSMLGISFGFTGIPFTISGSQIKGLPRTIISDKFLQATYSTEEINRLGYSVGFFFSRRSENNNWLGGELELTASKHISGFDYSDIKGLTYQMRFNYWYVVPELTGKIYIKSVFNDNNQSLLNGFFLRAGLYGMLNVSPKNVTYTHQPQEVYNKPDWVEKELQEILQGKPDFGFIVGVGYEIMISDWVGLSLNARRRFGFSDVVVAAPNTYGFESSIHNNMCDFQVALGLAINLSNK